MTPDLNDPIAVLLATTRALEQAGIEHATYGGLALAVYGEPRTTRDADLAVAGCDTQAAADALAAAGLEVHVTFDRVVMGGHFVTRLSLIGAGKLNAADLVEPRSDRYATQALSRAMTGTLRGTDIAVLSPEDFVVFKLLSTRARDLEDARTVIAGLRDRLDLELVRAEATTLATEIPDHDIAAHLAAVLGP